MKKITKKILLECGVGAHLDGFRYLGDAIELVVEEKERVHAFTKFVYVELGKRYGIPWSRIERAVRHAVETSVDNLSVSEIAEIYGNSISATRGKPTNSQFVVTIAELYGDEIRAGA